jgi:WD40 repeat protein
MTGKRKDRSNNCLAISIVIITGVGLSGIAVLMWLGNHFVATGTVPDSSDNGQCAKVIAAFRDLDSTFAVPLSNYSDLPPINSMSAADITEVGVIGRGSALEVFVLPDNSIGVLSPTGLWKHDADDVEVSELLWSLTQKLYGDSHNGFLPSPDGQYIAVGLDGWPEQIPIWDALNGKEITSLSTGDSGGTLGIMQFSPNSRMFAATIGNEVHVWDVVTGVRQSQKNSSVKSSCNLVRGRHNAPQENKQITVVGATPCGRPLVRREAGAHTGAPLRNTPIFWQFGYISVI